MARKARAAVIDAEQQPDTSTAEHTPAQSTELAAITPASGGEDAAVESGEAATVGDVAAVVHPLAGEAIDGQLADDFEGFARIDPRSLVIGDNVRTKAEVADLVADIRERGVRTPIEVYRNEQGQYVVITGQRRTLAAIQAARPLVPVMIVQRPADDGRIVEQVQENDLRHELTLDDRVGAYEQLSAFGLNAGQIAKKFGTDKKTIEAGLKLARSANTRAALGTTRDLDIAQGALIAELAETDDALRAKLTEAARTGQLAHEAQRVRDERASAAFKDTLIAQLAGQNIPVVPVPDYRDRKVVAVNKLKDRHNTKLDPAEHVNCPGHSAYLIEGYRDRDQPYEAVYACRDIVAYSHYRTDADKLRSADMTPEQRAQSKAERADVVASNRAWMSAETVRRRWLKTYLARKSAPKTANRFVFQSLAHAGDKLTRALTDYHPLAVDLLAVSGTELYGRQRATTLADTIGKATDARAQMIALGIVLAAYEAATGKHSWRHMDADTARYLTYLEENGYPLSPVELRAMGNDTPADASTAADLRDGDLTDSDDIDAESGDFDE